jgi:Rrf2 family iron-sulfur cluster assembly transcriptional regulator
MALVELAARTPPDAHLDTSHDFAAELGECAPVSLAEIAAAQALSVAYLEQIFARLRRAGLIASARGAAGGYRLARRPCDIAVGEIIDAVDEPICATRCAASTPGCMSGERCRTHDLWDELGEQIRLFLHHTTLADVLVGQVRGRARPPLEPARAVP